MEDHLHSENDSWLLEKIKQGDGAAFRRLFDKYWQDLFRLACKRLPSREDAADIVQEVFLSLWNNHGKLNAGNDLAAYLFVSLRNRIFNYYEKQAVRFKYLLNQSFNPVQSEDAIVGSIQQKELQQIIAAEIEKMPDKMREIYQLSREQQLSISEIATLLMISPQTVKNQLHRALDRLRQSLRDQTGLLILFF
jgi:RNA polymerase sigma-70 factor (ECF subfamily)